MKIACACACVEGFAEMTLSAPFPFVNFLTAPIGSSFKLLIVWSTPNCFAVSRRLSLISTIMTFLAPRNFASFAWKHPIGPAPMITIVSPNPISIFS